MSNPTATQFAPTAPLHAPSTASRALLAYGIGAGALGLLALGALLVYRRRLRWKRSREKRMSFGIDHDGGSDDSGADKFDGATGAASVPLMSLPSSSDEQSRSRSRSRTTSITFAPLPVPAPRDSAFFYDPASDSSGAMSLNDPLPPPRSPNGAAAVHTHYTAAPHLPALAESRESHRMSDTTTSPRTYDAPPPVSSNAPPLPSSSNAPPPPSSSNAPPPPSLSNAPPPPSLSNAPPPPSSSNEPPPPSSPTANRI